MRRKHIFIATAFLLSSTTLLPLAVQVPSSGVTTYGCATAFNFDYQGNLVAKLCESTHNYATSVVTFQSVAPYWGVQKYMSLQICKVSETEGPYDCASDAGQYYYYAGPLTQEEYGEGFYYHVIMYDGNGNKIVDASQVIAD